MKMSVRAFPRSQAPLENQVSDAPLRISAARTPGSTDNSIRPLSELAALRLGSLSLHELFILVSKPSSLAEFHATINAIVVHPEFQGKVYATCVSLWKL